MTETPLWRQWFDMFEAPIRKQTEAVVTTEDFVRTLIFTQENWGALNEKTRGMLTKLMHLSNVPAHSDVTKLSRQVGALTHKVDTLLFQMEAISEALEEVRDRKEQLPPRSRPRTRQAKP